MSEPAFEIRIAHASGSFPIVARAYDRATANALCRQAALAHHVSARVWPAGKPCPYDRPQIEPVVDQVAAAPVAAPPTDHRALLDRIITERRLAASTPSGVIGFFEPSTRGRRVLPVAEPERILSARPLAVPPAPPVIIRHPKPDPETPFSYAWADFRRSLSRLMAAIFPR